MRLFGQDLTFYDLLESQAKACHQAAEVFHLLITDFAHVEQHALAIKEIEHDADTLIHQLHNRVDSTFVTPLDKEDLNSLSSKLDDITDSIEAVASRFVLYNIGEVRSDMIHLAEILVEITRLISDAVGSLRDLHKRDAMQATLAGIHKIESEGDMLFRRSLADLFNTPMERPMMVIKWKDIYERTEKAIDRCEQMGAALESVLVKYA